MQTLPAGAVGASALPVHVASLSAPPAAKLTFGFVMAAGASAGRATVYWYCEAAAPPDGISIACEPRTVCPDGIVSQAEKPRTPCSPFAPLVPLVPLDPLVPFAPAAPFAPGAPGSPFGPAWPTFASCLRSAFDRSLLVIVPFLI